MWIEISLSFTVSMSMFTKAEIVYNIYWPEELYSKPKGSKGYRVPI